MATNLFTNRGFTNGLTSNILSNGSLTSPSQTGLSINTNSSVDGDNRSLNVAAQTTTYFIVPFTYNSTNNRYAFRCYINGHGAITGSSYISIGWTGYNSDGSIAASGAGSYTSPPAIMKNGYYEILALQNFTVSNYSTATSLAFYVATSSTAYNLDNVVIVNATNDYGYNSDDISAALRTSIETDFPIPVINPTPKELLLVNNDVAAWQSVNNLSDLSLGKANTATVTTTTGLSTQVIQPGTYLLECWGAQGGNSSYASGSTQTHQGGYGGYSKGYFTTDKQLTLYKYVGGQGATTGVGGVNGGGSSLTTG